MNTLAVAFLAMGSPLLTLSGEPARPIMLNFSQTDVSQIFRAIGTRTGSNIVFSSQEKLPVTIHINAGDADEAIRGTASAAGLSFRKVGGIYVVAKPDSMRQALDPYAIRERIEIMGEASELAKIIQDAVPHATVRAGANAIFVTGVPDDVLIAREMVKLSQERPAKESLSTQLVTLKAISATKAGSVLSTLFPTVKSVVLSEQTGPGGTLALMGSTGDVLAAKTKAQELDGTAPDSDQLVVMPYDIRYSGAITLQEFITKAAPSVEVMIAPPSYTPPSVAVRSTLVTGSTSGSGGAGGAGGGGGAGAGAAAAQTPAEGNGGNDGPADMSRSKRLVLKGRRGDVQAALALLQQVDFRPRQVVVEVKVIDTSPEALEQIGIKWTWNPFQFFEVPAGTGVTQNGPSPIVNQFATRPIGLGQYSRAPFNLMAVLDAMVTQRTAKVLATPSIQVIDGDNANIFIGDTLRIRLPQATGLGTQTVVVGEFPVGIGLAIRPRVNADGYITMAVNPQVSTVLGVNDSLPQTATREAQTSVMVRDGETMVIGGLIKDEDIKVVQEVPLLSKLPIVGQLFRNTSTSKRQSNVLIMITPRIVKDSDAAPAQEQRR